MECRWCRKAVATFAGTLFPFSVGALLTLASVRLSLSDGIRSFLSLLLRTRLVVPPGRDRQELPSQSSRSSAPY